jgi:glycosyltransferase involved in cell wall biosynthesis
LPKDAAAALRRHLGKHENDPLRIAYVPGPGDVVGTFDHWRNGLQDPRVPVITYSGMFYSLLHGLSAQGLVLAAEEKQPALPDQNVTFRRVYRQLGHRGLRYRWAEIRYAISLARTINSWRPDITIIGSDAPPSVFGWLRGPTILSAHNTFWPMGQRPKSSRSRLSLLLLASHLRHVTAAICTSSECARQIVELGGFRPTFVEVPQVSNRHVSTGITPFREHGQSITFVGRIEENKGVFDLLLAFEKLSVTMKGLTLSFAGEGGALTKLRSAVDQSSVRDQIRLLGRIDSPTVHALLDASDIVVCPTRSSFNEGLAMVVVEAAIHGRPSVVSSVVPASELFSDGCLVFPADDPTALQAAIQSLLKSPAALRRLSDGAVSARHKCLDRSRSWGSQLFHAMLAIPPSHRKNR